MRWSLALLCGMLVSWTTSMVIAVVSPPEMNNVEDIKQVDIDDYTRKAVTTDNLESASISKVIQGACYSPFHNAEYPMNGGSADGLDAAMLEDFRIMKNYFTVVRTYYSSFFGKSVAQPAAAHGVKLFLGVFMTSEWWWESQYTDAVTAVRDYPSTVSAILVGNENVVPVGPYTPAQISAKITDMRNRVLAGTGRSVAVGTVQRAADWLDESRRGEMLALAANCDISGVNIYPFFDSNYNPTAPVVLLNIIWDRMVAVFGASKLRLTETGFPTGGTPTQSAPANIPSVANSQRYYNGFVKWNPSSGGSEAFWFMFFDRKPSDTTMQADLERYFGFYTHDRQAKAADYPVLLSALTVAGAPTAGAVATVVTSPPTTTTPPPTTTRPPTTPPPPPPTTTAPPPPATTRPPTTAPPPTTRAPTAAPVPATVAPPPTTASNGVIFITIPSANPPANVCRVRKIFY